MVVCHQRSGTNYRPHLLKGQVTFEDRTYRFSRNVNEKVPTYAASNPKRAQSSFTPRRKPHITHNFGVFPRKDVYGNTAWDLSSKPNAALKGSRTLFETNDMYLKIPTFRAVTYVTMYTECPRRNVPAFGRVFLMLKYNDITQNTYVQSWTVTEIMAREVWNFDSCYTLIDYQIHIKTGRNMWFL